MAKVISKTISRKHFSKFCMQFTPQHISKQAHPFFNLFGGVTFSDLRCDYFVLVFGGVTIFLVLGGVTFSDWRCDYYFSMNNFNECVLTNVCIAPLPTAFGRTPTAQQGEPPAPQVHL